jgi:transcriptional regulator with XRE-family HTH domain
MKSEVHDHISFVNKRRELGLTQRQIAEALGIQYLAVSTWERGINQPKLYPWQTAKLCELLQCSIDDLAQMFPKAENQSN